MHTYIKYVIFEELAWRQKGGITFWILWLFLGRCGQISVHPRQGTQHQWQTKEITIPKSSQVIQWVCWGSLQEYGVLTDRSMGDSQAASSLKILAQHGRAQKVSSLKLPTQDLQAAEMVMSLLTSRFFCLCNSGEGNVNILIFRRFLDRVRFTSWGLISFPSPFRRDCFHWRKVLCHMSGASFTTDWWEQRFYSSLMSFPLQNTLIYGI